MSKFVVVDQILEQLDAASSGVVPGSVTQAVVSGIQNVPANIIQPGLAAGGGCYTTFPLSPIVKNCNIDKTYLNLEFVVNLKVTYDKETTKRVIPMWIGFRDTASIFNQVQILIENSALYTTTYNREESLICYNALPETEIRGNNQYASIDKMKNNVYSPMKRILIHIGDKDSSTPATYDYQTERTIPINFKVTVDINRLNPLLSNLHYTTPHFGNLRLKVWIQKIQEAMFFCPDYNYQVLGLGNETTYSATVIQHNRFQPTMNQYWQFYPLSTFMDKKLDNIVPVYSYLEDQTTAAASSSFVKVQTGFTFTTDSSVNFLSFNNGGIAEIVQTCFDIKEAEYQRLSDYFASTGSIIIPTQVLETNVFNNSNISSLSNWNKTQIGTVGGYNINFLTVWSHPLSQATCFQNEFLQNIQLLLDGRPVNALPYSYLTDKAVVDTTQAIIDTDNEEINKDYISSLTCFNLSDDANYVTEPLQTTYGNGAVTSSIRTCSLSNPNSYMLNFSTNLPDAFHSGACILENSNRNGVVRFNSTSACDTNENLKHSTASTGQFPLVLNHQSLGLVNASDSTVVGFSAFCDCCLVLTYDPVRGTCFDGQLSWSAPYV